MRLLLIIAVLILLLPTLFSLQAGGWLSIVGGVSCLIWLGLFFLALAGRTKEKEDEAD